jgi:glycosyltransferase involved in cell wall biosynthesis
MRIVYDITNPCIDELRGGFRMGGIGRVARAWARGVHEMDGGFLMSTLPESLMRRAAAKACLSERPIADGSWAAAPNSILLSHSGLNRGLVSRGCGYSSHHLLRLFGKLKLSEVLAKSSPTDKPWIYHNPFPMVLPGKIPKGCVPVINIYDIVVWIFRDTYSKKHRTLFDQAVCSLKRHNGHAIVNSINTRHSLVSYFDLDPSHIHVIPLGCDISTKELDNKDFPDNENARPYMLYVASSDQRRKNIPTVIKAFQKFTQANGGAADIVIAGSGTEAHQALADRLLSGLDAKARCLGYVDEPSLEKHYRGAGLGLYLSLYEGFGLPILEYMSRNVPVICGNETSLPEVAGDAAVTVDSTDSSAIARAMEELWFDKSRLNHLATVGRRRAEDYSWDNSVRKLHSCYEAILAI